ncbi:hypothetical protein [Fontivita pretiosa]|uniref:hypothetical protein n=1 Tax=Fontivita pretiosa TaxID=2989684 RepID=UPI003D17EAFB
MPDDTQRFAQALYEFSHSAGWMLSLQRRLDKAAARMIPARDTDRLVAKLATDIEQAWREVQAAQEAVRAAAVAPPIPIAGLQPTVWLHGVLCAVVELAELVGGRLAAARLGSSTEQDARCDELRRGLEARIRELRELSSMPAAADRGQSPAARAKEMDPVGHAVLLVKDHPDWSCRKIAKHVGCHHTTLTRSALFLKARELAKGQPNVPKGYKTSSGSIEAVAE